VGPRGGRVGRGTLVALEHPPHTRRGMGVQDSASARKYVNGGKGVGQRGGCKSNTVGEGRG